MKTMLPLMIATLLSSPLLCAQQTGSWGDQGDGTYKNPVLESNYPDNDVIRVDDTFYMMSSTNHFVPGMVILKSNDLVNWEFSNAILPAPITYDREFNIGRPTSMVNRGTWAGSFGYNGAYYFAYWCFNKRQLKSEGTLLIVYSQAKSLEGPWTEPKEITWPDGTSINTTDPGVFWDRDTHQAWIGFWYEGAVRIYRMSWEGDKLLQAFEEGIVVTREFNGEAVKIYKFDGMYFLMNAHWRKHDGVRQRMATFQRAEKIEGPWEGRLVMENGNGTDRSPSQGTLIKLDDGSWWFIHQLARGKPDVRYNGRPQFLEPVTWRDGWPLIGVDTDGDGIGEVVWEHEKPIKGFPVTAPATDDDFNGPELGLQWNWRFNPQMDRWSLTERPGFLRLKSCISSSSQEHGSFDQLPNLIGQRLMGRHNNVMTAKFDLSGMAGSQECGFHVSAGDHNVIGVKKEDAGGMHVFFKRDTAKAFVVQRGPEIDQTEVWFRVQVENGLATFFYSLDGNEFIRFGDEVRLLFSGFTPNMVGFYSRNAEEQGHLDIDWFKYEYDGPKGR